MSDVMWIVTNHEEKQPGLPFRVDSARLFVMSDVILIVIVRDCRWCCPWYKARMAAYYAVAVCVARAVLYAAPCEGLCHTDSVRLSYMVDSGCSVWSIKV
jgi:hypothetical protein